MFWEDIYIVQPVSDRALADGLATAFHLTLPTVLVVDSVSDSIEGIDERFQIVVERWPVKGDAELRASIYVRSADAEQRLASRATTLATLKRLARKLGSSTITGDESLDPSAWLLIHPGGSTEPVTLEDHGDQESRIVVSKRRVAPVA